MSNELIKRDKILAGFTLDDIMAELVLVRQDIAALRSRPR